MPGLWSRLLSVALLLLACSSSTVGHLTFITHKPNNNLKFSDDLYQNIITLMLLKKDFH